MPRQKIRDLACRNPFDAHAGSLYEEYKALLMNAVTITGLPAHIERFVKACMIERNQIGYDKITGMWSIAYGEGLNAYWLPKIGTFVFPDKKSSYQRPLSYDDSPDGAYLIKALPTDKSFSEIIEESTHIMHECDKSIMQNLKASRTPFIAIVKDADTRLSVLSALEQKEEGAPAVVVSPDIAEGLKGLKLDTPYIVGETEQYREIVRDRLLNKIGMMTANINKKERVQVGEVNATYGQCVDYIYLWIDTFNKQLDTYAIPHKMVINESLEEVYGGEINDIEEYNTLSVQRPHDTTEMA